MDHSDRKVRAMESLSKPNEDVRAIGSLSGPSVRLKRHPERGDYDRERVFSIIDEALLAHVAFTVDGEAMALPTAHARIDDNLYLHGAKANRMLRSLCERERASVTFTLLDGLVLARTAFHHSMNFRSVVVFGKPREVVARDEKRLALHALIEHMAPGRMSELTTPTDAELDTTLVICVSIEEASAKLRAGDPIDARADLALDVWAGTVPLALIPSEPRPDGKLRAEQPMSQAAAARALWRPSDVTTRTFGEYELSSDPARVQFDYVYRFLSETAYWSRGIREGELRTAMQNSICFGVYQGRSQVGFARVVSDRGRFAYLCDVFIDADQRGRGLGKALVELALEHPAVRSVNRILLGTQDAHTLYERFGFTRTPPGRFMIRVTAPEPQTG
jgi:nitroimidazol reductase NimA-like FMN-containing flavoprotein (pyridoxamine 5'-phosphate oxidase superfamily)/GNAT superfamily N-acetyltransferase